MSNLGKIQIRGKARTWGVPTTCTIVYRHGKWYASISLQCTPQRNTGIGAIGLDFGCLTAVAASDGTIRENPRFLATATHCGGLAATVEGEVSETSSMLKTWAG
ncbi:hypothetical protein [Calothrix sp. CCY 0018]|uniref:hypothetical protein n=1 Tax=Calothrix sp. CCY 0018 TaxID=3103864 RepID=UPI0039C71B2F